MALISTNNRCGRVERSLPQRGFIATAMALLAVSGPASNAVTQALASPLWTLSGVVETSDGHLVGNAPVMLSIVTSQPHAAAAAPVFITETVTASDGSFSIPAPTLSTAAMTQALSNDGWLNLELDTSATIGTANGDVMYLGSKGLSVLVAPSRVAAAPIGTVRSEPNGILLTAYGEKGDVISTATQEVSNLEHRIPCVDNTCYVDATPATAINTACQPAWYAIGNQVGDDPVGEFHTWDDMTGRFTYGSTASTNLGLSFNYSDGSGWNLSGSNYMGNSSSYRTGTGTIGADYAYQQDGEFSWEQDESDSGCQGRSIYRIVPTGWTGGFVQGANVSGNDGPNKYYSVEAKNRANIEPGAPVDKANGTGYTYRAQVSAFGVTLSAETDYSSEVTMHWDMGTTGVTHSLFGFGGSPNDANVQLVFASTE